MNGTELPAVLQVSALRDPAVESIGYAPESSELTRLWTPVLGPAAAALYRALALLAPPGPSAPPEPVEARVLACALGLSDRKARLVLVKSLHRLDRFGFVSAALPGVAVRLATPPLPRHLVARVPPPWQGLSAHRPAGVRTARAGASPAVPEQTPPAGQVAPAPHRVLADAEIPAPLRRSALSLLRQGVPPAAALRQLARWGDDVTLVEAAVRWAAALPEVRGAGPGRRRGPVPAATQAARRAAVTTSRRAP